MITQLGYDMAALQDAHAFLAKHQYAQKNASLRHATDLGTGQVLCCKA